MELRFSRKDWWEEIGRNEDLPEDLIILLRQLVNSALNNVIPPNASEYLVNLCKKHLQGDIWIGEQLCYRIMVYVPMDTKNKHPVMSLVPHYSDSVLRRLEELIPVITQEGNHISFNQLRERLQQGLELLLTMLPEGDEPELDCEYCTEQGARLGKFVPNDPRHNLSLLHNFSAMVNALHAYPPDIGRTAEEVLAMMGNDEGGAQLTFIETTDAFLQRALD